MPLRSARGRLFYPKLMAFQREHDPRQRRIPDSYNKFVNRYQRSIIRLYDQWRGNTQRVIQNAISDGLGSEAINRILEGRLNDLRVDLEQLGRSRIASASELGLGKTLRRHLGNPNVIARVVALQDDFVLGVRNTLIPQLREQFLASIDDILQARPADLRSAIRRPFVTQRARLAPWAGSSVVAIFETQREAGLEENRDRRQQGEPPLKVRWVLDDLAAHCSFDPKRGTMGCPDLARVYESGWDSLPTVPAGNVSCLGNCRCHIEVDLGNGFERLQ